MSHRNTHNPPKKRKSPPISTFSPLHPKAQQNQHLRHPQNTLPHPQKAPQAKRTKNDENQTKNQPFSVSSVSPPPHNQNSSNPCRNRLQTNLVHPPKVQQAKQRQSNRKRDQPPHFSVFPPQKNRKFPAKHRQITPYPSTTMDWEKIRNLLLEVKDDLEERRKITKGVAEIIGEMIGEMRADLKTQVPPTLSTPSPIALQPSYSSVSTQTTPHAVPQPSYTSISTQTEPLTEIVEIATPVSTSLPVTRSPPPISVLAPILPPPSSLLPIIPTILVSPPISESWSGSTTLSRPQPSPNRLDTLRRQPYPTSRLRPQPEPPPGDGPTSRVRRGRRTLMRG